MCLTTLLGKTLNGQDWLSRKLDWLVKSTPFMGETPGVTRPPALKRADGQDKSTGLERDHGAAGPKVASVADMDIERPAWESRLVASSPPTCAKLPEISMRYP